MKEQIEKMRKDLTEIFNEEYEKRGLITPQNTAEKMSAKGYQKQSEGELVKIACMTVDHDFVEHRVVTYQCTNCLNTSNRFDKYMKFCPNCGAKMKGVYEL